MVLLWCLLGLYRRLPLVSCACCMQQCTVSIQQEGGDLTRQQVANVGQRLRHDGLSV
jgi:hypothetical protein